MSSTSTITGAAGGVSLTSRNESTLDHGEEMPFATAWTARTFGSMTDLPDDDDQEGATPKAS